MLAVRAAKTRLKLKPPPLGRWDEADDLDTTAIPAMPASLN
jgi:hypothetical protein